MKGDYRLLSREETNALFVQLRTGKPAEARKAYRLIVESMMAWARKRAMNYCDALGWTDRDEAESAAYEGIVDAVQTFDISRGTKFSTHAGFHVFKQLVIAKGNQQIIRLPRNMEGLREETRMKAEVARGIAPIAQRCGNDGTGYDHPPSKDDSALEKLMAGERSAWTRRAVRRALGRLNRREADILTRHLVNGETLPSIGKSYGISRERVRQLKDRALEKVKKYLARRLEIKRRAEIG